MDFHVCPRRFRNPPTVDIGCHVSAFVGVTVARWPLPRVRSATPCSAERANRFGPGRAPKQTNTAVAYAAFTGATVDNTAS